MLKGSIQVAKSLGPVFAHLVSYYVHPAVHSQFKPIVLVAPAGTDFMTTKA